MPHRALRRCRLFVVFALAAVAPASAIAQGQVTTPRQFFGYDVGADYVLPNYTQFTAYWQKVAAESPRAHLDTIGLSAEGRPQLSLIVSSPENIKKLARYKEIARKLAYAEMSDTEARALAKEGKAVIWIDGGLHATEVLGANQLIETSWQFLSMNDEETLRILNDVIIVFVHANPDGMELVANWYMQEQDPKKRNSNIPRLYQKYIGHDNNRDFYIANQNESINMNKWLYLEWYPQIMYNHHQTGPAGAVMFAPPFRDPANYNLHPSIITGLDLIGGAMHGRMVAENKPGVVNRSLSSYSTWWNGGLRTMVYFHNMLGILTETIGNPTPMTIPFIPDRLLRNGDQVLPLAPNQEWHFRQSIDYSVTANRAILDLAQRYREFFLYNIYSMGRDQIQSGSKDSWITTPKLLASVKDKIAADRTAERGDPALEALGFSAPAPAKYYDEFKKPENRMPRGYVIPSDQSDFLTADKFIVALQKGGIIVHRANAAFSVGGKQYPKGSFVVKTSQAFRPHVLDMFEPQDHPNDFKYPGAPPTRPYDNAGWTLALQMGVKFDRVLEAFDGPFDRLDPLKDRVKPAPGAVASAGGWVLSPKQNDSFHALGRLWKAGADVYRLEKAATSNGRTFSQGSFYIPSNGKSEPVVRKAALDLGLNFEAAGNLIASSSAVKPVRIGLWDRYGGSMPSGHARWLFEQFELPFQVVYPREIDAGGLKAKFDVLVLYENAVPGGRGGRGLGASLEALFGGRQDTTLIPQQFRGWLGSLTQERSLPKLKEFLDQGGRIVAIGPSSLALAGWLDLPITNHLTERTPTGATARPLPGEKFYVPGSLLEVAYDTTTIAARGQDARGIVFFDNSATFRLLPEASLKGVKPVAWFENAAPLRSGWAWGQNYLDGGVAAVEVPVGKGMVFLYGPEVTFRAQPHGTFKLLFNGIVGK
jgi:hypothetical protein